MFTHIGDRIIEAQSVKPTPDFWDTIKSKIESEQDTYELSQLYCQCFLEILKQSYSYIDKTVSPFGNFSLETIAAAIRFGTRSKEISFTTSNTLQTPFRANYGASGAKLNVEISESLINEWKKGLMGIDYKAQSEMIIRTANEIYSMQRII